MEQRANSFNNETGAYPEAYSATDQSHRVNCSISDHTCSRSFSELNLQEESLSCLSSSVDAELDNYNKRGECVSDICGNKNGNEACVLGEACNNIHFSYKECDDYRHKNETDEDSQLEYHSAEEQDCYDQTTSYMSFEHEKTSGIQNLEVLELVDSVCRVATDEEDSFASGHSTMEEFCNEAAIPELPQMFVQDSVPLMDYKGLKCENEHTNDMYRSILCENSFESDAYGSTARAYQTVLQANSLENQDKIKHIPVCDNAQSAPKAKEQEVSKKRDGLNHMLLKQGNPCILPWETSVVTSTWISSKNTEDASSYICEESFLSAFDTDCDGCTQKIVEAKFSFSSAASRIPVRGSNLSGAEIRDKSAGDSTTEGSDLEQNCHICLNKITCNQKVTINQTVDASSDFRACFTTSRATNAKASVASRADNTEITMMNKTRPKEWQTENYTSVACNTDLSCIHSNREEIISKLAETGVNGTDTCITAPEWISQIQDPLKLKNNLYIGEAKENPERMLHLTTEVESCSSHCCKKILQRAIKADLQLLQTHYWMCRQHCWKIYKLVTEEKECFSRNLNSNFVNLVSAFEELKVRYKNMREKLVRGIPLDALPPLSVESKLLSIFSSYIPSKLVSEDLHYDVGPGNSEMETLKPKETETSTSLTGAPSSIASQRVWLPASSKLKCRTFEENYKDEDVEKDLRKSQELYGHWFDAKENLTATDLLVTLQGNAKEQGKLESVCTTVKTVESRRIDPDEQYFICVSGLSPSVLEVDLRSHFSKYEVSEVSVCGDPDQYRYAFLSFKKASKAKLAVEEMNGKEIKGKAIIVCCTKTAEENISPASQKLSSPPFCKNQVTNSVQKNVENTDPPSTSLKVPVTTSASVRGCAPSSACSKVPPLISTKVLGSLKPHTCQSVAVTQKTIRGDLLKVKSVQFFPDPSATYMPPNTLNLSSFTKLMKKLQELHPEASRNDIVDALLEVRTNNNGFLSGLSINAIVEMASLALRKDTGQYKKK
ncbi:RNA-binding protein 44 isoform X2 [Alligator mississippiensis]|uniref:RNA-binding protein 44 isoform X2 n=1 Tax=Alligator mississippiensis TaxID=8496 RepID=UPI0007112AEC|nr:RNA-binding protein 44 isoform X2 [Alligator mississippiensis]